jgi:hypothetical protein
MQDKRGLRNGGKNAKMEVVIEYCAKKRQR